MIQILEQPVGDSVFVGDSVLLHVDVDLTGGWVPGYQWYHMENLIVGANSSSYQIDTTSVYQSGAYRVQIWDTADTTDTILSDAAYVGVTSNYCDKYPSQNIFGLRNMYLNSMPSEQWDIVLCEGVMVMIGDSDYIGQKAKQILQTIRGELEEDSEFGVAWYDDILGHKNPDIEAITNYLCSILSENPILVSLGVESVTTKDVVFSDRTLTIGEMLLSTSDGGTISTGTITI